MEYLCVFGVWHHKWEFWCPLQFTRCSKIRFLWHSENQLLLLLPVIHFCVIHFKTLLYAKSYIAFMAVFPHNIPGLALASLFTHTTWTQRFSLQLSLFRWNPIYRMVSPYKSASWTDSLTLHLNFHTGTSKQSFSYFFVENFHWLSFLLVLLCKMCALTTTKLNRRKKISSTILLSSFQMNNMTSGLICPHQFYTCCSPTLQLVVFYDVPLSMMVPQQVYLHGQWLVKRHHRCSSTWWARGDPVGVIFFRLFSDFQKCLFRHFFSIEHHCANSLCFATP